MLRALVELALQRGQVSLQGGDGPLLFGAWAGYWLQWAEAEAACSAGKVCGTKLLEDKLFDISLAYFKLSVSKTLTWLQSHHCSSSADHEQVIEASLTLQVCCHSTCSKLPCHESPKYGFLIGLSKVLEVGF